MQILLVAKLKRRSRYAVGSTAVEGLAVGSPAVGNGVVGKVDLVLKRSAKLQGIHVDGVVLGIFQSLPVGNERCRANLGSGSRLHLLEVDGRIEGLECYKVGCLRVETAVCGIQLVGIIGKRGKSGNLEVVHVSYLSLVVVVNHCLRSVLINLVYSEQITRSRVHLVPRSGKASSLNLGRLVSHNLVEDVLATLEHE